jgi:hypothetical protein
MRFDILSKWLPVLYWDLIEHDDLLSCGEFTLEKPYILAWKISRIRDKFFFEKSESDAICFFSRRIADIDGRK